MSSFLLEAFINSSVACLYLWSYISIYFSDGLNPDISILVSLSHNYWVWLFWLMKEANEKQFDEVILEIRSGVSFILFCQVSAQTLYMLCLLFPSRLLDCFDYKTHWQGHPRKPGSNTISLSSAILAALCLASRLPDPYHTFALLSTAVILLALWPVLTRRFRNYAGDRAQICLTVLSGSITFLSSWPLVYNCVSFEYKCILLCALVASTLCLNFVGPWYLLKMQKIKRLVFSKLRCIV
ncbi:unnamed protein product [Heterobilharzia americana]|nr:unnamed protein product [Heterobilharzia americana]